ncbi:Hypothetical predicted protein [Paramuricea clavata]|uniref:DUF5641 domain-containing protein n=1 Tax=Paramuricea clavata TaxID=317549 RepID=A0A6S7HWJ2_PARCT|nr:Hypothetical predicted protein [Paramuricea clavata]
MVEWTSYLYQPIESWGLMFGLQKNEALPGEKKIRYTATAASEIPDIDYKKSSDVDRIIWMVAKILSMARHKLFRGGSTLHITSQLLKEAEDLVVKDVQKELKDEIEKTDQKGRKGGRYASLNPGKDEHGYYVVGQRLKNNNPMTPDASLQKLLPTHHPVTRLFMERAHKQCVHRGRDSTLARSRQKYWIAQGSKIAQTVKSKFNRAERELKEAWDKIDRSQLHKSGLQNGLTWKFGSADSPWYQGAVESPVKAAKRAIVFAVGKRCLTVSEFLTSPVRTLDSQESWRMATFHIQPESEDEIQSGANSRRRFLGKVDTTICSSLVVRRKWHVNTRNLRPGDVVMIADKNVMRGEYRLGVVKEVFPDQDGKVRRVLITYKNFRVGSRRQDYGISEAVTVSRSVQRLALLVRTTRGNRRWRQGRCLQNGNIELGLLRTRILHYVILLKAVSYRPHPPGVLV